MSTPMTGVEPELQGQTPRRVCYTWGTQFIRLFLLLLLIGGVWLVAWLGTRDLSDLAALRAHGAAATARVYGKHETNGRSTTYYLDYSFTANGEDVYDDESVSYSLYDGADVGDPISITYLPSHPQTHRVGVVNEARVSDERTGWTVGVLATLALLGGLLGGTEAGYRRRRRLLEEGVPVVGEVTDRKAVQGKSTTYYVTYRFPGPGGDHVRKIVVTRRVYEQFGPGQPLTVLYDSYRPDNNRPYCVFNDMTLDR